MKINKKPCPKCDYRNDCSKGEGDTAVLLNDTLMQGGKSWRYRQEGRIITIPSLHAKGIDCRFSDRDVFFPSGTFPTRKKKKQ